LTILQIRIILNKHGLKRLIKNQESYLAKKTKSSLAVANAGVPLVGKFDEKKENMLKTPTQQPGKSQLEP
jgi:hypothetical protein